MKKILFFSLFFFLFLVPIFKVEAAGSRFRVDFGASGFRTLSSGWNNVYSSTDVATWYYLVNTDGATSSVVRLKLASPFTSSINTSGATTSSVYPDTATKDSFVGNASTTPQILIEGLNPNNIYGFNFYASENSYSGDIASYTLTGLTVSSSTLATYQNINNYASINSFKPDSSGQVNLSVGKKIGSNGSNYYLGVLDFYELMGVTASDDQTIKYTQSSVTVSSQATSTNGVISSYLWEQLSGPATSTISTPSLATTSISNFSAPGDYVFKVTATDNQGYYSSDNVAISVTMVDAGSDQIVIRPNTMVNLSGSVQGYDENTQISWTETSSNQSWIVSTSSLSTLVKDIVPGTYNFRLTATKGSLTQYDDVVVTVQNNPATVMQTPKKIVIMGDSTAWGAGSSPFVALSYLDEGAYTYAWGDNAWAALFNSYFKGFNASNSVVNIAKIGLNTYQAMPDGYSTSSRPAVLTDFNITKALSYHPDLLVVGLSTNDANSFWSMDEMIINLRAFKDLAAAQGIPVWFFTPHPRNFSDDVYFTALEKRARVADLLNKEQPIFSNRLINIYDDFYNEDLSLKSIYDSGDGVHMNNAGHKRMYNRVVSANLVEYLGNRQPVVGAWTSNQSIFQNESVSLSATITDPDDQSLTYSWQQISGPTQTHISSASSTATSISGFSDTGDYSFKITATDIYGSAVDKTILVSVSSNQNNPPENYQITYSASTTSAVISWTTDINSSSVFNYGHDLSYKLSGSVSDNGLNHSVNLSNLAPGTIYFYQINSTANSLTSNSRGFFRTAILRSNQASTGVNSILATGTSIPVSSQNTNQTVSLSSNGNLAAQVQVPAQIISSSTLGVLNNVLTSTTTASTTADVSVKIEKLDSSYFDSISNNTGLQSIADKIYRIELVQQVDDNNIIQLRTFDKDLRVSISYSDNEIISAGLQESTLTIRRYDVDSGWSVLSDCSVDVANNIVSCNTRHLSDFALFGTKQSDSVSSGNAPIIIAPSAIDGSALDFSIDNGKTMSNSSQITINLNGDPKTIKGYSISLDKDFSGASILNYSSSTTFQLPNKDGDYTIYIRYYSKSGQNSNIISHRIHLSLDSLNQADSLKKSEIENVSMTERENQKKLNVSLTKRLAGRILLQVEEKGQSWYLEPVSKQKYFMGQALDAFNLMKKFGLGISNFNLNKFMANGAPVSLSGRILLSVEKNGEAYYVNPSNLKLYSLGRSEDAYNLMRTLSVGISNNNIRQIETAVSK